MLGLTLTKYLWRINVEKKGYTYHTALYDKRFNGIYGIMMTAKSTYTDVDIDVVKKAIKDALSFIKEDERYTQSVLQYKEDMQECRNTMPTILTTMIIEEDIIR